MEARTDDEPDGQDADKGAYHVLKQTNAKEAIPTFRFAARNLVAANAEAAIRHFVEGKGATVGDGAPRPDDEGAGIYVAVPARSWKPVTVTSETKTVLKLT
jgi:hypothetical protein